MEKPETPLEFRDDEAGARARRKAARGMGNVSDVVLCRYTADPPLGRGLPMGRAIDKQTASDLFQKYFPGGQGLNAALATVTFSLELRDKEGRVRATVYRLPSGVWIEPEYGHYIEPSTPWAQMFDQEWQYQLAHPTTPEPTTVERSTVEGTTEKQGSRFRALLRSFLIPGS
jgi:hypothetical protein